MKKKAFLLSGLLVATMLVSGACGKTEGTTNAVSIFSRPTVERTAGQKKEWMDVDSFVCYYGPLSGEAEKTPVLGGESVSAMENLKKFDVAIIHSSQLFSDPDAKELVKELQDNGTYVIAYLTIGEDDKLRAGDGLGENGYASYYICENGMPKMNSSWGSYFVDAGNPVWQQMVVEEARSILDYGADGLFLDTLDTVDVAYDTIGGMVDLVKTLDETFPEAKLVVNRGFTIFSYISSYVDGIMFESFSTTYDSVGEVFVDRNEADMNYNATVACNVINRARRYDYMPVFCLDYVNASEYSYMPKAIYDNVWQYDFIPYVTYSRALDVCPCPGIKPTSERGSLALSKFNDAPAASETNGDTSSANLAYAGNELCTVTVDSVFAGYSGAKPLTDGFYATKENHNQMNWATEAWASENNNQKDHWIQFAFKTAQDISSVTVYWAADGEGTPTIYSAREAYVEAWIDGEWVRVASYNWKSDSGYLLQQEKTEFTFDTVTTDKIRVFQPKGMGDATTSRTDGVETTFSGIMWVSEVEIH